MCFSVAFRWFRSTWFAHSTACCDVLGCLVTYLPLSSWAKQRLEELLGAVEFDASESTVTVVKVDKLEGDAEVIVFAARLFVSSSTTVNNQPC